MPKPALSKVIVQLNAYSPYRLWSIGESVPDRIARSFPSVRVVQSRDNETFLRFLPEATVLFSWSLPRRAFLRARKLKWMHTPEGGSDRLLFPEMLKSEVQITNSRGLAADAIADHTLGLVLTLSRRLADCRDAQRQRLWARDLLWSGDRVPFALSGRTLVVLGLGQLGQAIARRARAFGMTVVGVRRSAKGPKVEDVDEVVAVTELDATLARADVLALALPLTAETRRLMDAQRLACVKPACLLINIGRGELVDEDALAEALSSGRLGGAGLDVFDQEPLPKESPLWDHPRVVISPHVAGTEPDHMDRVTELFERNLTRFLAGEPLVNLVDKHSGY